MLQNAGSKHQQKTCGLRTFLERVKVKAINVAQIMLFLVLFAASGLLPAIAWAQPDFERDPIRYSKTEPTDVVHQLGQQLAGGKKSLKWDAEHGYLKSLLAELDIPVSSQTLVFSKTSLQVSRISPEKPRAVYFNDDIYVGWVQHGDLIEISTADSKLGGTFYSIKQNQDEIPVMKRETRCLQCHASSFTRRTPGHLVRSVFPTKSGQPEYRLGTHISNDASPISQRFGGWYVTGTHGDMRHMGNVFLSDPKNSEDLDIEKGANVTDLSSLINTKPYLSNHSDIVALMVMQHQSHMHNVLAMANHAGQRAAHDTKVMNKIFEREKGFQSESTLSRYRTAAEKVVKALLFCDEVELTDQIRGSSQFVSEFEQQGPFDSQQRSLRQFDLKNQLFRYPCSYLIYSDAFKSLPDGVMIRVRRRLDQILSGEDESEEFTHLSSQDRTAIRQILRETGIQLSTASAHQSNSKTATGL